MMRGWFEIGSALSLCLIGIVFLVHILLYWSERPKCVKCFVYLWGRVGSVKLIPFLRWEHEIFLVTPHEGVALFTIEAFFVDALIFVG